MIDVLLTSVSLAVIGLSVHQFTKRIDIKPFNCELCMVFWVSVILTLIEANTSYPVFYSVQYIGMAIFTRQLLWKIWPTMF